MTEEDFLAHYGVKGMKWGVRKDRTGHVKPGSIMRKDRKVEAEKPKGYDQAFRNKQQALVSTYKSARPKVKKAIKQINNAEAYKGKDLRTDKKLRERYHKEVSKAVRDQLNAAATLKGTTFSGYKLNFDYDIDESLFPDVSVKRVPNRATRKQDKAEAREIRKLKHSDDEEVVLNAVYDDKGFVIDFEIDGVSAFDEAAMHGATLIHGLMDDELLHYGVPGMKWGVRRDRTPSARQKARAKKKLERTREKNRIAKGKAETKKRIREAKEEYRVNKAKQKLEGKLAKQRAKDQAKAESVLAKERAKYESEAERVREKSRRESDQDSGQSQSPQNNQNGKQGSPFQDSQATKKGRSATAEFLMPIAKRAATEVLTQALVSYGKKNVGIMIDDLAPTYKPRYRAKD